MSKSIIGSGSLSILDMNDAIISGQAPSNPIKGTLWIDTSKDPDVLYMWNGSSWVKQHLSVGDLDPGFKEEIDNALQDILTQIGNLGSDGIITSGEKLDIKLRLVEITGSSNLTGNTLPTFDSIKGNSGGQVGAAILGATGAKVPSDHTAVKGLETAYNNLKTYLEKLTPRPWLTGTGNTTIVPSEWESAWNGYYIALNTLNKVSLEYAGNNLKPGTNYNGVTMTAEEGIVVLRKDGKVRAKLNAADVGANGTDHGGITIERKLDSGAWEKVFYADTNGILNVKGLKISNDSYIGNKQASEVNNQVFNVIGGQITSLMDRTTVTVNGATTTIKEAHNQLVSDVSGVKQTISETQKEVDGLETSTTNRFNTMQNTVNGLSSTVGTTKTKVDTVEGDLNSYKTTTNSTINTIKSDVSGISAQVATVDSRIETAKGQAVSTAQTYTNSQINVVKGLIEQKVEQSDIDTALAGLKLGGRNYLQNSNFDHKTAFNKWTNWGTCTRSIVTVGKKKYARLTATTTAQYRGISQTIDAMVYPDETVTISYYAYAAVAGQILQVGYHQKKGSTIVSQTGCWFTQKLTTSPTRYSHTFKTTSSSIDNLFVMIGNSDSAFDIYITDIKHEKASKATDWTPAYEDIEGDISDAYSYTDTQINTVNTKISQTADSVTTTVTKYADNLSNEQKGKNKWLVSRYSRELLAASGDSASDVDFKHIAGIQPVEMKEYADTTTLQPFTGEQYLAHYYTNVFFETATNKTFAYRSDDNSVVYLNGEEVHRQDYNASNVNITIKFPSGWSTLEVLQVQGTGGQVIYFNPAISSSVGAMAYNIAPKAASSIRQLANSITMKVSKDGLISTINMDESGVQIAGEKVDIEGQVTFKSLDKGMSDMFEHNEGNNTTIINGGYIKTGTVTADKLNAHGLTIREKNADGSEGDVTFSISEEGDVKVSGEIVSMNYSDVPGSEDGYKLTKNGDAFLNNAILRGDVITENAGITNFGGIGRDNLLKNSTFKTNVDSWTNASVGTRVTSDGKTAIKISGALTTSKIVYQAVTLKPATTYTISALVKVVNRVAGTTNPHTQLYLEYFLSGAYKGSYGGVALNSNIGSWQRVSKTFTTGASGTFDKVNVQLYIRDATGDWYFTDVKLEEGSTVTSWTPHSTEVGGLTRFWAGATYDNRDNAPFKVLHDGTIEATKGNFGGTFTGSLDIGNIHITDTNTSAASFKINTNNDASTVVHMTDTVSTFSTDFKLGSSLSYRNSTGELNFAKKSIFQSRYADVILNGTTGALEFLGDYGGRHTIEYLQNYGGLLFNSRGTTAGGGYDFRFARQDGANVKVQLAGELSEVKLIEMGASNKVEMVSRTGTNSGIDFMVR